MVLHLGRRADGEGVPLTAGDAVIDSFIEILLKSTRCQSLPRDLDKDPISWIEVEIAWSINDQVCHSGGKTFSPDDKCLAPAQRAVHQSEDSLPQPDQSNWQEIFPELRRVEDEQEVVEDVEVVGEVEDLEVSPPPDTREGAGEHDEDDDKEKYSCGVCEASKQTKQPGSHGEDPV